MERQGKCAREIYAFFYPSTFLGGSEDSADAKERGTLTAEDKEQRGFVEAPGWGWGAGHTIVCNLKVALCPLSHGPLSFKCFATGRTARVDGVFAFGVQWLMPGTRC